MAISSMQQPRQMYGLGSLVKKITRPLKKIAKSPLGKAALLGGGAYLLGGSGMMGGQGMFNFGAGNAGRFGRLLSNTNNTGLSQIFGKAGKFSNIGNMFRQGGKQGADFSMARLGLGALGLGAVALPFMAGGEEEEEIVDPFSVTPGSISDIRNMARMRDPSLAFMPNPQYTQKNFYAADGGIAKLSMGGGAGQQQMMQALQAEYMKYRQNGGTMPFEQYAKMVMQQQGGQQTQMAADGGRIGYNIGGPIEEQEVVNEDTQEVVSNPDPLAELNMLSREVFGKPYDQLNEREQEALKEFMSQNPEEEIIDTDQTMVEDRVMANAGGMIDYMSSANPMADSYLMEDDDIVNMYRPGGDRQMAAEGGIMDKRGLVDGPGGYAGKKRKPNMVEMTGFEDNIPLYATGFLTALAPFIPFLKDGGRVPAQEGGIMDLGGMEKDYREEGGFVPIGGKEKADDVPARLSKNEFVFTADAVRNAGGGDIDAGAEVMENMMNHLEQGGQVSEESQGGNPAQEMFDTAQQLESRIA